MQLQEHFNSNNLLAEQHYGYRPNHSTESAAVKLVDHISNTMDGHKIPGTIFIDLSKAFVTLSCDILLYKPKFYGISGLEHKLIASYLSNRKQYVMYHITLSPHTIKILNLLKYAQMFHKAQFWVLCYSVILGKMIHVILF